MSLTVGQFSDKARPRLATEQDKGARQPLPSFLCNPRLQLLFFGGKGGVGKTTSAAAAALLLARAAPERHVLIISTDPAHSLGDSLDEPVGRKIVPVRGVPNLSAVELDPSLLLETFKRKHGKHLKKMAAGTVFSHQADIRDFLSFRLPGMEDLMVFQLVAECLQRGIPHDPLPATPCDLIVVDTAPTGHALRLLEMPEKFTRWLSLLKRSFDKYRRTSAGLQSLGLFAVAGQERGAPGVPRFLNRLMEDIGFIGKLLEDSEQCEFVMVTIPEEMAVAETARLAGALDRLSVGAQNVVVNRVRADLNCAFCRSQAEGQTAYLSQIEEQFAPRRVLKIPLFPGEIRGRETLGSYGLALAGRNGSQPGPSGTQPTVGTAAAASDFAPGGVALEGLTRQRFLIFGGKGGVGKTSVSASSALHLARRHPEKRVLVVSTDPAHSLGDSLDLDIGDSLTPVPGLANLSALELDAAALYDQFRNDYVDNINDAFEVWQAREIGLMNRERIRFDRSMLLEYVQSYPPGIEEVLVMERLLDFVEADRFDRYVLDPAPTGHMLKLLAFPELIKDWLRVTYRAILKYQQKYPVENLDVLAERMVRSTHAVKTMRAALTDPAQAELVAVTIPEAMGALEMERMLKTVAAAGIPAGHIICNFMTPETDCAFCRAKCRQQRGCLKQIAQIARSADCTVTQVRQFPHEVRGLAALEKMAAAIYGERFADDGACADMCAGALQRES